MSLSMSILLSLIYIFEHISCLVKHENILNKTEQIIINSNTTYSFNLKDKISNDLLTNITTSNEICIMLPLEIDSSYISINDLDHQFSLNEIIILSLDIGIIMIKEKHNLLSSYYHFGVYYTASKRQGEEVYEISSLILNQYNLMGNVLMIKICYNTQAQFIIEVNFLDKLIVNYSSKDIHHYPPIPHYSSSSIELLSKGEISFNKEKSNCSSFHLSVVIVTNSIEEASFDHLEKEVLAKRYLYLSINVPNDIYYNATSTFIKSIRDIANYSDYNSMINHAVYYEISFWFHITSYNLNDNLFHFTNFNSDFLDSNDKKYIISLNYLNQIHLTYYDIKAEKYIDSAYITTILSDWNFIVIGHNLPLNKLQISIYDKCTKIVFYKVITDILLRKLTSDTQMHFGNEYYKGYIADIRLIVNHYSHKEYNDLCALEAIESNLYIDHNKRCRTIKTLSPIIIDHCPTMNITDKNIYYHLGNKLCQQNFSFGSVDIFTGFSLLLPSFSKFITVDFWFLSNNNDLFTQGEFSIILQSSLFHQIRILVKEPQNEDYLIFRGEFILKGFEPLFTDWIIIKNKDQWHYVRISINFFEQVMNIKTETSYKEIIIPFSFYPMLFNLLTTESYGRYYFQDLRLFDNYLIPNVDVAYFKLYYNEFGLLRHYYFNPIVNESYSYVDLSNGNYYSYPLRKELEIMLSKPSQVYQVIQWEIKDGSQIYKMEHCDLSFAKGKKCYYCSKGYLNVDFQCLNKCPENYALKAMNDYLFCVPNRRKNQGIVIKETIFDSSNETIKSSGRILELVFAFYMKDKGGNNEVMMFGLFTLGINYQQMIIAIMQCENNKNVTFLEIPLVYGVQYHFVLRYHEQKIALWLNGYILKLDYDNIIFSNDNHKYNLDINSIHSSTIVIILFRIWSHIPHSFLMIYNSYLDKYKEESFPQLLFHETFVSNTDNLQLKYHNCQRKSYYNITNGKCDKCSLNCNECFMDLYHSVICSSCKKKYSLVLNQCLPYTYAYYIKQRNSNIINIRDYLYNPYFDHSIISIHFLINFNNELAQVHNEEIVLYTIDKSIIIIIKNTELIIKGNTDEVSHSEIICHSNENNDDNQSFWNFYSINIKFNIKTRQYDLYSYINEKSCSSKDISLKWNNNNGKIFLSNIEILNKISYSIGFFIVSTKNYHDDQSSFVNELLATSKNFIIKIMSDETKLSLIEMISLKYIQQEGINQIGYEAFHSYNNIICGKGCYYSINFNKCNQCNSNCIRCLNEIKCVECTNGYHLINDYQCESDTNEKPLAVYSQLYNAYIIYDYSLSYQTYQSSFLLSQTMTMNSIDINHTIDFTIDFWIFVSSQILKINEKNVLFDLKALDVYNIKLISNEENNTIVLRCNSIDKMIQVNLWSNFRCAINHYKESIAYGFSTNEQYYSRNYPIFSFQHYQYDTKAITNEIKYIISKDVLPLLIIKYFSLWSVYLDQFNIIPSSQTILLKYNWLFDTNSKTINNTNDFQYIIPILYYPLQLLNDNPKYNSNMMTYAENYNIRLNHIPQHYYKDNLSKIFRPCHHTCSNCNGKLKTNCLLCSITSPIFNKKQSLCISQCLNNAYYDYYIQTCLINQSLIKSIDILGRNYIQLYDTGKSFDYISIKIIVSLEDETSSTLAKFDYLSQFEYDIKRINDINNKNDMSIKGIQSFGTEIVIKMQRSSNSNEKVRLVSFIIGINNKYTDLLVRKEYYTFLSTAFISPYIKVISNTNMMNTNDYPLVIQAMNILSMENLLMNRIDFNNYIQYKWNITSKDNTFPYTQIEFISLNSICSSIIIYDYPQLLTIELNLSTINSTTILYHTKVDYSIKLNQKQQNRPIDTYIELSKNSTLNDLMLIQDQIPLINYEYKIKAIPLINRTLHLNLSLYDISYITNWSNKDNSDLLSQNSYFDYSIVDYRRKRNVPFIYTDNIKSIYLISKEKQNNFFTGLTHKKYNYSQDNLNPSQIDIQKFFYCQISPKILTSFINDTLLFKLYTLNDFDYLYYRIIVKDSHGLYYKLNNVPLHGDQFILDYFPNIVLVYIEIIDVDGFHHRLNCQNEIIYSIISNKENFLLPYQSILSLAQEKYHYDSVKQFNMIYYYSTFITLTDNEAKTVYSLFKESLYLSKTINTIDLNFLLHFLVLMNNHHLFYLHDTDFYKRIIEQFLTKDYLLLIYWNNAHLFYCFYQNLLEINYNEFIDYKETIIMLLGKITHDTNSPMFFKCISIKSPSLYHKTYLYRLNYFNERTIELYKEDLSKRLASIENIQLPLNDYPQNMMEDFIMMITIEENPTMFTEHNIIGNEIYKINKYYFDKSNIHHKEQNTIYSNTLISFEPNNDVSNMTCVVLSQDKNDNNKTTVCESWFSNQTYVNCICNHTGIILLIKDKTLSIISKDNQIKRLYISISIIHIISFNSLIFLPIIIILLRKYYVFIIRKSYKSATESFYQREIILEKMYSYVSRVTIDQLKSIVLFLYLCLSRLSKIIYLCFPFKSELCSYAATYDRYSFCDLYNWLCFYITYFTTVLFTSITLFIIDCIDNALIINYTERDINTRFYRHYGDLRQMPYINKEIIVILLIGFFIGKIIIWIIDMFLFNKSFEINEKIYKRFIMNLAKRISFIMNNETRKKFKKTFNMVIFLIRYHKKNQELLSKRLIKANDYPFEKPSKKKENDILKYHIISNDITEKYNNERLKSIDTQLEIEDDDNSFSFIKQNIMSITLNAKTSQSYQYDDLLVIKSTREFLFQYALDKDYLKSPQYSITSNSIWYIPKKVNHVLNFSNGKKYSIIIGSILFLSLILLQYFLVKCIQFHGMSIIYIITITIFMLISLEYIIFDPLLIILVALIIFNSRNSVFFTHKNRITVKSPSFAMKCIYKTIPKSKMIGNFIGIINLVIQNK